MTDQTAKFLHALAPEAITWTFQTFDDGDGKRPSLARTLHGSLDQHRAQLLELNRQGAGVFVTVNETDGKGRKADNIARVRAVFADFDNPATDTLERLRADPLPPSIIVESSMGKLHAYWLADGLALEQFKSLQQRIAASWGSDPAVCDLPRVMRLPGFDHRKGEPCPVTLLEVAGHTYDAWELVERYTPQPQAIEAQQRPAETSASTMTHYATSALASALGRLHSAAEGTRNDTLNREAFGLAQLVAAGELPEGLARDSLLSAAASAGLPRAEVERTLQSAFDAGSRQPRGTPERTARGNLAEYNFTAAPDGSLPPIAAPAVPTMLNEAASSSLVEVELGDVMSASLERVAFAVHPWLPKRHVTLFGGHGGMGKSTVALAIAAHVACGLPFAGFEVEQSPVLFVSLEDEASIVRLRLRRIIEAYRLPAGRVLENLRLLDGTQGFAALMTEGEGYSSRPAFTAAYREMAARAEGAGLIVVDNASDAFDANENSRQHVRMFVRGLAAVARHYNASVMLLAHIDKAAAKGGGNGNDYSGSTAWHNSARSRLALLNKDGGNILLEHQKANLSKLADPVPFTFVDGVPMPLGAAGSDGITSEDFDQAEMVRALKAADEAGIIVPAKTSAGNGSAMQALDSLPEYFDTFKGSEGRQRASRALAALKRAGRVFEVEYKNEQRHIRKRLQLLGESTDAATSEGALFERPEVRASIPPIPPCALTQRAGGAGLCVSSTDAEPTQNRRTDAGEGLETATAGAEFEEF